ncbi:MAG: bifunctional riboflavin kinase/FAD synthetase [Zoogloeaceae bacterium]|nr:bifunctional riboflavin kinase/FAD synthetase [Zoogloeaceae bacterium]
MQLIRGHYNLRPEHHGCVATIGNFDGVHLGHVAVLERLAEKSREFGLPATVITFEPTPLEYFMGDNAPARLTRFREKYELLRDHGLDRMFCLSFDANLAHMPASEFIERVLVQGLGIKYLVVGDDFRFGRDRAGDFDTLTAAGQRHDFEVVNMHTYVAHDGRVSSTRVRQALAANDLQLAEHLLGRQYSVRGKVVHGDKRGRTIGFPTANVLLRRKVCPVSGVYAVDIPCLGDQPVQGVANVGKRPTVGGTRVQLEVHLFDYTGDIYGREVEVRFLHHIRPERKFESFDALKQQIFADCDAAKAWFETPM